MDCNDTAHLFILHVYLGGLLQVFMESGKQPILPWRKNSHCFAKRNTKRHFQTFQKNDCAIIVSIEQDFPVTLNIQIIHCDFIYRLNCILKNTNTKLI